MMMMITIAVVAVKAVAGTRQRWVEEVTTPGAALKLLHLNHTIV